MSVANLAKLYVHINKFGLAAGRVVGSNDLCNPYLKYEVLVKFEEAMEASSNSLQQLKAEILLLIQRTKQCACADDMGSVKGLLEQIDAKLSAV